LAWEGIRSCGRILLDGRNRLLNIDGRSRKKRENRSLIAGRFATGRLRSGIGNGNRNAPDAAFPKGDENDDNSNL
jgi:hypothetical protein